MANIVTKIAPFHPVTDRHGAAFCQGWTDVREGRGFPKAYDGWGYNDQSRYEFGRSFANHIKVSRGALGKAPNTNMLWEVQSEYWVTSGYNADLELMRAARKASNARLDRQAAAMVFLASQGLTLEEEVY